MRAASRGIIVAVAVAAAFAQQKDAHREYEAAEIKPNTSGDFGSHSHGSKGQVIMTNMSLKALIGNAYNMQPLQVEGPDWLEKARFDIKAKYPEDTLREDRSLMLRSLLQERLKLAVHRDSREMPGYALTVAKSGFKLKPVEPGPSGSHSNGDRIETLSMTKASMAQLADVLARPLGQTVVDKTGIAGVYDFEIKWMPEDLADKLAKAGDTDEVAPSLFTVLTERLGLKLQPQKVPVEIVVVDHVERVPAEN